MLTEEQARQLLCPVISKGADQRLCVASRCAAWRWSIARESARFPAPNAMATSIEESGVPDKYRYWIFEPYDAAKNRAAEFVEPPELLNARSEGTCALMGPLPPTPLLVNAEASSGPAPANDPFPISSDQRS